MFCIECGQELPVGAKFCSRCGTAINNISNTTPPPIMDDVAAKAEDVVITDEMPSLDAQGVNDDVLRKASFIGYPDNYIPTTNNYTPINTPSPKSITDPYPKVSKTTFFGGQLTLVKIEHSKDDTSYELQGVNFTSDKYSHVYQTSVDDCIFIAHTVGDKQKILLRWDYRQRLMVQDISESFTHIKAPFANYFKVERNGNIGYVCFDTESKRLKYVIDCKYPSISVDNYSDNQLIVFGVNNYSLVCSADSPKEEYNTFIKITDNIFKAQKRGEQSYALLQWDKTQKRLIYALSSHNFDYISNDINLSYIKVKENGKYGYIKVNDNGYCDLKIPCIFDNVGTWEYSYKKEFEGTVSDIIAPIQYNGKNYRIDPHMQFYAPFTISRWGRSCFNNASFMLVTTFIITLVIVLWGLFGNGYIMGVIGTDGGEWFMLGLTAFAIFCLSVPKVLSDYTTILSNKMYKKIEKPYGEHIKFKKQNYIISKLLCVIYIANWLMFWGIFTYELYIFNFKYDNYNWGGIASYDGIGVAHPVKKDGKWGYIDFVGREIIPLRYDAVTLFDKDSGFARVILDGKFGVINLRGKTIIPSIKYDYIGRVENGLAKVNMGGTFLADDDFLWYSGQDNVKGGKWGYINMSGDEIISPQYDYIESDSDLLVVNIGGLWGVKKEGNNEVHGIHGGKWGIIDRKGNEITPVIWDKIIGPDAKTGTYRLNYKNQSITINKKGERFE